MSCPFTCSIRRTMPALFLMAALVVMLAAPRPVRAAPASMTYTGQLLTSLSPPTAASGSYDMKFQLYTAATGGLPFGAPVSLPSVPVVSGLYYVQLYFGSLFTGATYWIQVSYRPAGSAAAYTLVSPRPIAPDAAYANYATLSGSTLALQGKGISTAVPTVSQVLTYDGTLWAPAALPALPSYSAGTGLSLVGSQFSVAVPLMLTASTGTPVLTATNTGSGNGLYVSSAAANGIVGVNNAQNNYGVLADAAGNGVYGATSVTGTAGAYGYGSATSGTFGVIGTGVGGSTGVYGASTSGTGVQGLSSGGTGVLGTSTTGAGGLLSTLNGSVAVYGATNATGGNGGYFAANHGAGAAGVQGISIDGTGIYGYSSTGTGVYGFSSGGTAGYFNGNVTVTGAITAGTKDFKIDHPLDPSGKYLYHASVESSEMKDIYDGVVILGSDGSASVQMPAWFGALNSGFRYQLTAIGGPAPGLYVAQEIADNRFGIAGGKPGLKVSWQVTGVRHDAFALAHPLQVEQEKPEGEQGLYQNPDAFGLPAALGIGYPQRQAHERPAPPVRP